MNPFLDELAGYDEDEDFGDALSASLYGDAFGADDEDFGGRANQAFRGLPAAMRKRAQAIAARQRGKKLNLANLLGAQNRLPLAVVTEHARGDDVIYGLDTGSTNVAAAATVSVSTTPQKRHIPKKISLTSTVAGNFILSDIRVGVEPVLATTGNISLAIFIQDSTSPPFRAVLCEVGMDFTVVVTNVNAAGQRFTATVIGTYVPPFVR